MNPEAAASPIHLLQLFAERAAAGDVEGLIALYEPGAVFQPRPGTVLRGVDQIRPALAELAALKPTIEYASEPNQLVADGIAVVANVWTMTAHLTDGTTHREGGVSADVLRRQPDGSWLVLIDAPRGAATEA